MPNKEAMQIQRYLRANPLPIFAISVSCLLLVYTLILRYLQHYRFIKGPHDFWHPVVFLAFMLLAWGGLTLFANDNKWLKTANKFLLYLFVWMIAYLIYRHTADWLGWVATLTQTYWDQLANSFLHGKLYLENPSYYHDLTKYQSQWYVPNPPLPAVLLIPLALLVGSENINAVRYSLLYAATNALLLLLILDQVANLNWIRLNRTGRLWLVALFAFGSPHWYVGMNGQMWFMSQVMTVTFTALAILIALKNWPPWIAGACLGLAICARPDVALLWPCLVMIYIQHFRSANRTVSIKQILWIMVQTALFIGLAGIVLLLYNYARFGNWLDFGYVTINGAEQIVKDAQAYGIFNIHFIPRNINVMLLGYPEIRPQSPYLFPSRDGMSILLTTPAFIFLFRKQKLNPWKIGALVAIFANLILLAMYHNTGNFQFGYAYMLDFVVPLFLILAAGFKEKLSIPFKLLVILSVVINLLGTIWFAFNW